MSDEIEIDGMTIEQIKFNVYAFGRDVKTFALKRDASRKEHTRAKWQKKHDEAMHCLANNQKRLAIFFETEQQHADRLAATQQRCVLIRKE